MRNTPIFLLAVLVVSGCSKVFGGHSEERRTIEAAMSGADVWAQISMDSGSNSTLCTNPKYIPIEFQVRPSGGQGAQTYKFNTDANSLLTAVMGPRAFTSTLGNGCWSEKYFDKYHSFMGGYFVPVGKLSVVSIEFVNEFEGAFGIKGRSFHLDFTVTSAKPWQQKFEVTCIFAYNAAEDSWQFGGCPQ